MQLLKYNMYFIIQIRVLVNTGILYCSRPGLEQYRLVLEWYEYNVQSIGIHFVEQTSIGVVFYSAEYTEKQWKSTEYYWSGILKYNADLKKGYRVTDEYIMSYFPIVFYKIKNY